MTTSTFKNDIVDPALLAPLGRAQGYHVIVDAWEAGVDTTYRLDLEESPRDADSVSWPKALEIGIPLVGDIGYFDAAEEIFDSDFYSVTLAPGEAVKVAPSWRPRPRRSLRASPSSSAASSATCSSPPSPREVEGLAAATLYNAETTPQEYILIVDEFTNIPLDGSDDPDYVWRRGLRVRHQR